MSSDILDETLNNVQVFVGDERKEKIENLCKAFIAVHGDDVARLTNYITGINTASCQPPLTEWEVSKIIDEVRTLYAEPLEDDEQALESIGVIKDIALPDVYTDTKGNEKIKPTARNLKALLKAFNVEIYYEVVLKRIIIDSHASLNSFIKTNAGSIDTISMYISDIAEHLNITKFNSAKVSELLTLIACGNTRNIPLERLEYAINEHPDSTGEIDKLFSCFEFLEGDPQHYKNLLIKWLSQVCAMLSNSQGRYGAESVLALYGAQGIGKGTLGRWLCSFFGEQYFREGIMFDGGKDALLQATSCAIGELGEFTARKDIVNYLKNILTQSKDDIRVPYGRKSNLYPRLASYYASTNNEHFLADDVNRRFWVFPLKSIDLDAMKKLNLTALWAEAYKRWRELGQDSFRLSQEERAQAEETAKNHRSMTPEEQALRDSLNWEAPKEEWSWQSATDIAILVGLQTQNNRYIGRALTSIGYRKGSLEHPIKKSSSMYYLIPPKRPYVFPSNSHN